jgi:hypothetical protein
MSKRAFLYAKLTYSAGCDPLYPQSNPHVGTAPYFTVRNSGMFWQASIWLFRYASGERVRRATVTA